MMNQSMIVCCPGNCFQKPREEPFLLSSQKVGWQHRTISLCHRDAYFQVATESRDELLNFTFCLESKSEGLHQISLGGIIAASFLLSPLALSNFSFSPNVILHLTGSPTHIMFHLISSKLCKSQSLYVFILFKIFSVVKEIK